MLLVFWLAGIMLAGACVAGYVAGAVVGLFVGGPGGRIEGAGIGGRIGFYLVFAGGLLYVFVVIMGASGAEERAKERAENERVERCKAHVAAWRATGRRGDPPFCQGGYVVPATNAEGRDHVRRMRRIRHLRNVR